MMAGDAPAISPPPPPPPPSPRRGASARRARYGFQALALLLAVTACCALGALIADRFPQRFDVTATREHQLSTRTTDMLGSLNGDFEIVVAANFAELDPTATSRTRAVLGNLARATPRLRTTLLDIASVTGQAELDALLSRLLDRYRGDLERQASAARGLLDSASTAAATLRSLSDEMTAARAGVTDAEANAAALRKFLEDSGAVCRVAGQDIDKAVDDASKRSGTTIGRTTIPATEDAIALIRKPLGDTLSQLKQIGDGLEAVATAQDAAVAPRTRDAVRPSVARILQLRDQLARSVTAIDELPRTPLPSVARVLERSQAAIIVGPPGSARGGVTSISLASIFPPRRPDGEAPVRLDLRARTEELLAAGIASLVRDDGPIVMLVHGEAIRLAPDFRPFVALRERLALRGMDLVEWAAGIDDQMPPVTALNPGGKRPVVYVTISTSAGTPEAATRMSRLSKGIRQIVEQGRPAIISVNPSTLPAIGQTDPMVEFLVPLGVQADSGRPLLQQAVTGAGPGGRAVSTDLFITDPGAAHAITAAIRGQTTRLPWAIPLRAPRGVEPGAGVSPVMTTGNAGKTIWAESEWMEYRRVPAAQRSMVTNPPANDSSRDDGAGPWDLAVAIERRVADLDQRVLLVGSNGWFLDDVSQAAALVDNKEVLLAPGNLELFEAGVYWAARQESLIGTSALAQGVALIPPMSPGAMSALRWSLIAGLPLLVLAIGALWRAFRG